MDCFSRICASLRSVSSHKEKSALIHNYLNANKDRSEDEIRLIMTFLLPKESKRVYNVKDKQLINYFTQIFGEDRDEMLADLGNAEDVATTISKYFETNDMIKPRKGSTLTLKQVDEFLNGFANSDKDVSRVDLLTSITKKSTVDDLITIIRLLRNDLRINAGAKQVLDGLHPKAYAAFQTCRDLKTVVAKVLALSETSASSADAGRSGSGTRATKSVVSNKHALTRGLSARIQLMTPIKPMLAEACRSAAQALGSVLSDGSSAAEAEEDQGIMAEIKYDGERVQLHKKGNSFAYFSRSLKAVPPNKVSHLEKFIPQAFTKADELIIDSEILLLDSETNKPLPFGSLGVHKRTAFKNATVCLFVFDCLYLNGESLIDWLWITERILPIVLTNLLIQKDDNGIILILLAPKMLSSIRATIPRDQAVIDLPRLQPIHKRRKVLEQQMKEVEHRVLFSEVHIIKDTVALNTLMARVFSEGLEGLVLKPLKSSYEPGKRHWLKIKRDYLAEGSLADSVDLLVLGAYLGTGSKAGLASVFLMGAHDQKTGLFTTVTKCGNGFTDDLLNRLQKQLDLVKIAKDYKQVPSWLSVSKTLVPDFVVKDPKTAPVWEITGAEFSRASTHTAGLGRQALVGLSAGQPQQQGISIRFPRMTKERPDKCWREATSVDQLEALVAKSGQRSDWLDVLNDASASVGTPKKRSAAASGSEKAAQNVKQAKLQVQDSPDKKRRAVKASRHVSSIFKDVIVELDDRLEADSDQLIRQLIASGAQLTGRVPMKFMEFTSSSAPATFRLVSVDQPDSQAATTPVLTTAEVNEAIKQKRALWNERS